MTLDDRLTNYYRKTVRVDGNTPNSRQEATQAILSDLLEIIEQSRTESEWHIDGNVAIQKTGFITEQELRDKVKEYCK